MTGSIDESHRPDRQSWVESANGHLDFPIQNLPLGIFSPPLGPPRPGVAVGEMILDLAWIAGLLPAAVAANVGNPTLNGLLALPKADRGALRRRLSDLLWDEQHRAEIEPALYPAADCTMHLPASIGDYTDFYVGIHHATNVGALFRPDNPLLPNYKYVPIGYHGRASSVRVSGQPVVRPNGQRKSPDQETPSFGPTRRLDYELELGVWIAGSNPLGQPVGITDATDRFAGLSLLNDWSARDLQAWEYQPLGPFLAKNFHTSVSPWVITAEALEPFRIAQPPRPAGDPPPLPYLWDDQDQALGAFNLTLEVALSTQRMRAANLPPHRLSRGPATNMYWTIAQLITHHTSNGCDLHAGDLLGTGTISAPTRDGFGSLFEITRGGDQPVLLPGDETRTFLEDGDEVIMTARAEAEGHVPIGFGSCRAVLLPAPELS
ncbi:fumarylacetoacetase [Sphingobium yanoikuyae]|uniref:fumarylacetoacetase n=1 Tax=Sphingobium yanoikuyae TaxID=13690 RepID=A0A177JTW8_SPHYA|nr:fumarylacetoacetase [Sphingobium yanoikuyae]OAH44672.1 fumarylacetoacetase [Sphingobium yanoikuyae]